jgi:hypothetical protein
MERTRADLLTLNFVIRVDGAEIGWLHGLR